MIELLMLLVFFLSFNIHCYNHPWLIMKQLWLIKNDLEMINYDNVIQLTQIWILPQAIHLQLLFSLGLAQSIFWWKFLLFPTSLPVSQGGFYKTQPWTLRLQGSLTRLKIINFCTKKRLLYCCAEFSSDLIDRTLNMVRFTASFYKLLEFI